MSELDYNRLKYLRSLARQARKRMDKKLDRFAPKPGQPPDEAEAARLRLQRARDYARETEEVLRRMRNGSVEPDISADPVTQRRFWQDGQNGTETK